MAKHSPASRSRTMPGTGLDAIRTARNTGTDEEEERRAYEESKAEIEASLAALRAADKLGEVMENSPLVCDQNTTQIWGAKACAEKQYTFSRWYFMGRAIVDLFITQELYDSAEVEARRALAHKYGTKYAALGPSHSRRPHADPKLRKMFKSMVEQLAEKF